MDANIVKQLAAGKPVFLKRRTVSPEEKAAAPDSSKLKGRAKFLAALRLEQRTRATAAASGNEKTELKGRARFPKAFKVAQ
jgi:hypothetical protein